MSKESTQMQSFNSTEAAAVDQLEKQLILMEEELKAKLEKQAQDLEKKIANQKNKVLRKLWSVKIGNSVQLERENPNFDLATVLREVQQQSKSA